MSVLAVLEGSHRTDRTEDDGYAKLQNTYANMDVERDQLQGTGWFTEDPMEFYYLNDRSETKVQCEWERSYSKPIWKTTGKWDTSFNCHQSVPTSSLAFGDLRDLQTLLLKVKCFTSQAELDNWNVRNSC